MAQIKTPGKGAPKAPAAPKASTKAPVKSKQAAPVRQAPIPAKPAPVVDELAMKRAALARTPVVATPPAAVKALPVEPSPPKVAAVAASEAAPALAAAPQESPAAPASALGPKGEVLRHAMGEAVTASAHGALAVNDKVIEALQTQGHAALDLWRSALAAPHMSDVVRLQRDGARQAYETASVQWKDIAETTAHWFTRTVEPLNSAISDLKR